MEKPLVSICCITYNHAAYIRECLDGFIMQKTGFPFEILIHDDASTDGTDLIIKEYEKKYPQIFRPILQEENQYSKGIRGIYSKFVYPKARGKYIAICEGDDFWMDPLKLQKQVDFLEENDEYSLCFHNAMVIYENSNKPSHKFRELEARSYSGEEILINWTIATASVLFRNSKLDIKKLKNSNYLYGDLILFLTLAEMGKIWCFDEIMSAYRKHKGGLTARQDSIAHFQRYILHQMEIRKNFKSFSNNKVFKQRLSMSYLRLASRYLKKGSIGLGFLSICRALILAPLGFSKNIVSHIGRKNLMSSEICGRWKIRYK